MPGMGLSSLDFPFGAKAKPFGSTPVRFDFRHRIELPSKETALRER
jgi:hypothetical protein